MRAGRDQEAIQYGVNFLVPFKSSREEEELLTVCLNAAPVNSFHGTWGIHRHARSHAWEHGVVHVCEHTQVTTHALLHSLRTIKFCIFLRRDSGTSHDIGGADVVQEASTLLG